MKLISNYLSVHQIPDVAILNLFWIAQEIREYLFSDTVMEQDESTETEIPPQKQHNFSGMGGGGENSGKYDGFGNSPIQKGMFVGCDL